MSSQVDQFAQTVSPTVTDSVRAASKLKTDGRTPALSRHFQDPEHARSHASEIKSYVLDNLKDLLLQLEQRCLENGVQVHWANNASEANEIIYRLCRESAAPGDTIVKAKSMATEEIHLNAYLEERGLVPVETDLGEFVIQLDNDTPSHLVTPIIHKNARQVAQTFKEAGFSPYTESPNDLALQARHHLRKRFREAKVGISGVNFAIAETGRLVIVENEGNNRLSTTAPLTHIAVMGLEKLLPSESDLAVFLPLLAGSATNQQLTTYVHFVSGPRQPQESDGPTSVHLVILDNGRSDVLNSSFRDALKCIRCGACLNACPVYRQASGHGYGSVFCGPIGAVLSPIINGTPFSDLPFASTLCGACEEVCPVKIPIPDMLLELRHQAAQSNFKPKVPWDKFEALTQRSHLWRASLTLLPIAIRFPGPPSEWTDSRIAPSRRGRNFRRWWNDRP